MGTIGDLFADQLAALAGEGSSEEVPADDATEAATNVLTGADTLAGEAAGTDPKVDPGADPASPTAKIVEIILDETDCDPVTMRSDLRLRDDLGLDGLSLWSLVARVERDLKITLPDREVEAWQTVGDLLNLASHPARNSND